jgi:hypothetical protein
MPDDSARRLAALSQVTADYERLAREDPLGFAEYVEEGRAWTGSPLTALPSAAEDFPEFNS